MRVVTNLAIVLALMFLASGFPALAQETADIAAYPIDYCVVTGQKLGSMGTPIEYMHEGRLVRFCCEGCIGTFQADPEKYLAVLDRNQAGDGETKPVSSKSGCAANPAPEAARGCRPGCRR